MKKARNCADALLDLLEKYGVEIVFGIPGVHTLDLYRSLVDSSIHHVSVRHEQGAGFAADGFARVTGRPGVCFLISGPGVTNAVTPMGQAYADSIPMLVISSDNATTTLGRGMGYLHEVTDLAALTRPVTAFSAVAYTPEAIPELLAQAFAVFNSLRPRPVHIVIPKDVLGMATEEIWAAPEPPTVPAPPEQGLRQAAKLLAAAVRPLIVVGGGLKNDRDAVAELATLLGAPVVASNAAKGCVPADHPLSLGSMISRPSIQKLVSRADVVLVLGSELSETDSYSDEMAINGEIIRVDIDEVQFNGRYATALAIRGDAGATAGWFRDFFKEHGGVDRGRYSSSVTEVKEARKDALTALSPRENGHLAVLDAVREGVSDAAITVGDMTQLVYTGTAFWEVDRPGRWQYAAGFCTLGCALPMAIGAKLAAPDTEVVALVGDAGFQFTMAEVATAVENNLSLPIVVWNNEGLGAIRSHMNARDIQLLAVDYQSSNPDFIKLAVAYGCHGERPETLPELTAAIREAFTRSRPTIIDMREEVALKAGNN